MQFVLRGSTATETGPGALTWHYLEAQESASTIMEGNIDVISLCEYLTIDSES